jgi:hypothetical protein
MKLWTGDGQMILKEIKLGDEEGRRRKLMDGWCQRLMGEQRPMEESKRAKRATEQRQAELRRQLWTNKERRFRLTKQTLIAAAILLGPRHESDSADKSTAGSKWCSDRRQLQMGDQVRNARRSWRDI